MPTGSRLTRPAPGSLASMHRWDTRLNPPPPGVPPTSWAEAHGQPSRGELRGRRWRRTSRGFYVPVDVPRTDSQRIMEAAARLGRGGAVGGWAAAYWSGVRLLDGSGRGGLARPVLLCLGPDKRLRPAPDVVLSRDRLPEGDVRWVRGVPVTCPARTAVDGARLAASLVESVVFLNMMLASHQVTESEIQSAAAAMAGRRGIGQVRRALRLADGRSRSPMESRLRMVWMLAARLPRPRVNPSLFTLDGEPMGDPDLLEPTAGLVAEYDGADHRDLVNHTADNAREERFEGHGLIAVRVTSLDLARPEGVVQRLCAGHARGLRRDRRQDRWTLTPAGWTLTELP